MDGWNGINAKFLLLLLQVISVCEWVEGIGDDGEIMCIEKERQALLRFNQGMISSWEGEECCKWMGVQCSNTTGHVIALQLNGVVLRGNINILLPCFKCMI